MTRTKAPPASKVLDDLGTPLARQGFGPKDFAESYLVFERRYMLLTTWILPKRANPARQSG